MDQLGTARALVEDLRKILSDEKVPPAVVAAPPAEISPQVESASVSKNEALVEAKDKSQKGMSLDKKARAKRKEKKSSSGGHNPFKTKSKLGPGPRGGQNSKTGKWKCSCKTPYKCLCRKKGGGTKTIRIKRSYKKPYNSEYKKFRKSQKH